MVCAMPTKEKRAEYIGRIEAKNKERAAKLQAVKAALKRMFDIEMVKRVKDGNCFRWYL